MGLPPRDHISSALLQLRWLPVSIIINLRLSATAESGTKMPVINLVPFSLFVLPIFIFIFYCFLFPPFPLSSFFVPSCSTFDGTGYSQLSSFPVLIENFLISILSIYLAIPTGL